MLRFCLIFVFAFAYGISPGFAEDQVPVTSDVNHQGWYVDTRYQHPTFGYKRVKWKEVKTDCDPCKYLVMEYNFAMRELMSYRHLAKVYREMRTQRGKDYVTTYKDQSGVKKGKELDAAAARIGEILERAPLDAQSAARAEANVRVAANRAQKLRQLIADCEKQCTVPDKKTDIRIGVQPPIEGADPKKSPPLYVYKAPKWWKGPFDSVCFKCEKLARELNERIPHEVKIREIELAALQRMKNNWALDSDERSQESSLTGQLGRLEDHYKKTLKLYNECIKTCPPKKTACVFPNDAYDGITVGANSEVGSGAALKDKVEGQAKGMAMGAIGGLLGGSGFNLGGGGDDSDNKGPETEKDPTSGKFTSLSNGDTGLDVRAGFNEAGKLVISTKIDDSPGDGTFHAQWVETADGKVFFPVKYLIFDLYRGWSLSVWWTYDRWVDNKLVEHDEGDSLTVGQDYLGTFSFLQGREGIKNSIWYGLGFDTAVKGVRNLGTVYDFPDEILDGDCPLRLVNHITLPKEDPVTTVPVLGDIPMLGDLFKRGEKQDKRNLQVLIRPTVIQSEGD